ncbi:Transcriptional activator [Dionaea muscipula]
MEASSYLAGFFWLFRLENLWMLFGIVGMGKSTMKPFNKTRRAPTVVVVFIIWCLFLCVAISGGNGVFGVQILSKSKLEKCERSSSHSDSLNCTKKIVINIAVPSGSSGSEASMVAEVVEVEENSTNQMQTLRIPPVITINKSAAYALYELTYIRDVPYKPQEFYVQTRKCQPDADAKVVQMCERLRDEDGHIMEHTQPICCPCGDRRRVPSSCGNFFDKLVKGKANTAHCVRFLGDWYEFSSIFLISCKYIPVRSCSLCTIILIFPFVSQVFMVGCPLSPAFVHRGIGHGHFHVAYPP